MKNLLLLWTKDFKGLDSGIETYELDPKVWAEIGYQTTKSGETIPSAYGAQVPNIAHDRSTFTADNYSFGEILAQSCFETSLTTENIMIILLTLFSSFICLQFDLPAREL